MEKVNQHVAGQKCSKKIVQVQVVQHLRPGGIETMSLDLSRFSRSDVEVHIVSLEGSKKESLERWPRLIDYQERLHFLDKPEGISLGLVWRLARLIRQLKADIVHTHHIGPMLYGGLSARLALVGTLIHTEHDAWHLRDEQHQKIVKACVSLLRPTVVADAGIIAQRVKEHVSNAEPKIVHNGIDSERFKPGNLYQARKRLGLPQHVHIVGCAARLNKVKGHDVLLDAIFRLPKQIHLALAGNGEEELTIRNQAKELGISNRVHFLGHVEDMPTFYQAIDVFCLASRNEGLPLSPLEAQACGTPVVLSDVGACKEAVCPNTGIVIPAGDSFALYDALEFGLNNPPKVSPREYVVDHRDVRQMVNHYDLFAGIK